MRHSCATPNCVSVSCAWRIVSQSDWLPIMTATKDISFIAKVEDAIQKINAFEEKGLEQQKTQKEQKTTKLKSIFAIFVLFVFFVVQGLCQ
jgi:hypothetical protein